MKIQSDIVADSSSLESSRTEHTSRTEGFRPGNVSSGAGVDEIDLSSTARRISDVAAAEDQRASERVRELTKLYTSGHYRVEAEQLSRVLIASALKGASGDER